MKKILFILTSMVLLLSCDDLFNPAPENIKDKNSIYQEPALAQGLMINGYRQLPYYDSHALSGTSNTSFSSTDVATDDAVTNNTGDAFLRMAAGSWTKDDNPINMWDRCFNSILYINMALNECDNVIYAKPVTKDEEASIEATNKLFRMRIKGEAYGLRALHMFYLLQAHAGKDAQGNLLGVPVILDPIDQHTDFNKPRADFKTCLKQIYEDLAKAEELLPLDYGDINVDNGVIPQKYVDEGITYRDVYNRVMGDRFRQHISGRIVEAIRAQVALMAASPAYLDGSDNSWEKAAEYAAVVLNRIGGTAGIDPKGNYWYNYSNYGTPNLANGANPKEIIWRHNETNRNFEETLYPPTLYGNGWVNPSQNLVDAFPMKDGYPITESDSYYNPLKPYENRDPRLALYIVTNESQLGPDKKTVIKMTETDDAVGALAKSTRTGYYLRKFIDPKVNLTPNKVVKVESRFVARIRYTEIFLAYAEAAFEATKSFDGKANNAAYSAYDVIRAIRQRAGVGGNNDDYLSEIKGDENRIRELIHNERRLELCFEGYRFFDLRRWKDIKKLNEPIRVIKSSDGTFDFTGPYILDGERNYQNYMIYGPIPYSEIKKFPALVQNSGWE